MYIYIMCVCDVNVYIFQDIYLTYFMSLSVKLQIGRLGIRKFVEK